jgi:outer membrane protein OmpA-like peptidoglycan-associated protein
MPDRVKIYEERKNKSLPIWAWLLPLLVIAVLAFYLFSRHREEWASLSTARSQTAASTFPDLGTVHFDTDKATLTAEGQATLQRAADAMKANPSVHLRLKDYTDSTGNLPHNLTLSQQRTIVAADFLKGQGIDGSRPSWQRLWSGQAS